jgi:hypothetical protein
MHSLSWVGATRARSSPMRRPRLAAITRSPARRAYGWVASLTQPSTDCRVTDSAGGRNPENKRRRNRLTPTAPHIGQSLADRGLGMEQPATLIIRETLNSSDCDIPSPAGANRARTCQPVPRQRWGRPTVEARAALAAAPNPACRVVALARKLL